MNNQKQNRGRHRNNARRSNPSRQNFDSNGPGIRIRGNATQVYEKYIQLARDAQGSGDRVMAENMLQHAEHYYRILNDGNNDRSSRPQHSDPANESQPDLDNGDDTDNGEESATTGDANASGNDASTNGGNANGGNANGGNAGSGGSSGRGRGRRSGSAGNGGGNGGNGSGGNGGNAAGGTGSGRGRGRRSRSADAEAPAAETADSGDSPAAMADGPAQQELSITAE